MPHNIIALNVTLTEKPIWPGAHMKLQLQHKRVKVRFEKEKLFPGTDFTFTCSIHSSTHSLSPTDALTAETSPPSARSAHQTRWHSFAILYEIVVAAAAASAASALRRPCVCVCVWCSNSGSKGQENSDNRISGNSRLRIIRFIYYQWP